VRWTLPPRIALAFAVVTLGGCLAEPWGTLVVNHTNGPIEVLQVGESGERDLGSVKPGLTRPLHPYFGVSDTSCSSGTLVIRAGGPTGPEIARRTEPLCYRDSWLIDDPTASGSP
jgi:hypothetical protein